MYNCLPKLWLSITSFGLSSSLSADGCIDWVSSVEGEYGLFTPGVSNVAGELSKKNGKNI